MSGIDLVVPVGTDQHEVLRTQLGQQNFQQIERRRIKPLQIIEEQREWMFGPGEYCDKPPKHQLETQLGVPRRKLHDWWLFSDDQL